MRINNANGRGDLVMGDTGVRTDGALETVAQIMVHCDRTANPNDKIPDETDNPRGWWGDALDQNGDKTGSRVWLLDGKATPANRRLAADYVEEAVGPLVRSGAVLEARAQQRGIRRDDVIAVELQMLKPAEPAPRWEPFWMDINLATLGGV